MRQRLAQWAVRGWDRRGARAWLLWPLSLLYGLLAMLHRGAYALGLRRAARLPVPVVVVGNVVAGGGGKTPVVLALATHLRARGIRVGVVSRGYGRTPGADDAPVEVTADSDVSVVGDEPLLLARRGGVPVFVARRRAEAGRALLAAYPQTQVLLSDDGLQHHALQRNLTVCVFDARGVGNSLLLPAGPLRERGSSATWVLQSDELTEAARQAVAREVYAVQGRYHMHRTLAHDAVRADGSRIALTALAAQGPVVAVAGIARPDGFFHMLRALGLTLAHTQALPDHYDFKSYESPYDRGYPLICTEKDALKLWRHRPDAWAVPLVFEPDPDFLASFDLRLDARLSSDHRH
ncbi:MAG: tetraacyldisaccharide 4'-kinase [Burkholderiaceae bacterium]|nr:tetraacyldisaccharide 4'-kinase [Burkholderiaceae bacterium]MDZ4145671.1 tetraacyldisaccharide 4'-kinase [Burkholderiales bacterium]